MENEGETSWPSQGRPMGVVRRFRREFFAVRPRQYYLSAATWVDSPAELRGWMEFHRRAGVERFLIVHPPECVLAAVRLPENSTDATFFAGETGEPPHTALLRAAKAVRDTTRWLALMGPLDFLFSPVAENLRFVLKNFESCPGVEVFPYEYPITGEAETDGLMPTANWRIRRISRSSCAIVNPTLLRRIRRDGSVVVKAGRELVDERGRVAVSQFYRDPGADLLRIHRFLPDRGAEPPRLFGRRGADRWREREQREVKLVDDPAASALPAALSGVEIRNERDGARSMMERAGQWRRAARHATMETRRGMRRRRYLCMGLMFKNAADYLVEWIEFHRLVGFEHFYLYDQNSDDGSREVLEAYCKAGLVTLSYWPADATQWDYLDDCIQRAKHTTRWLALLDDDEFLFPARGESLAETLTVYEDFGAVVVPWLMFGSSGHQKQPEGLVTENFVRRAAEVSGPHKCIVDPSRVREVFDVHRIRLTHGYVPVSENGRPEPSEASIDRSVKRLRLHHYYTKSYEEAERKVRSRGYVPQSRNNAEQQARYLAAAGGDDYNVVEDRTIHRFLPALKTAVANPARR